MAGRFSRFTADYNLMAPEDMDELLFAPFEVALGEDTRERMRAQFENYEYYDGKQHMNESGELVKASELQRPAGLDYDPTRYATNYFKTVINRKARWQMSGKHGIHVIREQVDTTEEMTQPGYEPSEAQKKANERAENHEKLLYQLWHDNKMRTNLLAAARDRLIADRVVCKVVYNPNTGKLKWVWRPDTEFIPVFSDDDFEEMIACHFVRQKLHYDGDEEIEAIQKQTFTLEGEGEQRMCYLEEAVFSADDLTQLEVITPKAPMGLDFLPVVLFPVNDLLAENAGESEIADLREQNDILNQMNEDAIDSLKFEMFGITAITNAPENTASQIQIAPGAVVELRGVDSGGSGPSIKRIENGFKWKEAFKDQYMRVKAAMHEISSLPQVVPQEMNFGGLNGDTLHLLFQDIIADTEEHWLTWQFGLQELHEKSVKYLQARTGEANMKYDKAVINAIDVDRDKTEIDFVLPLPDNRADLVQLLADEMVNDLESRAGAMQRLGVENVQAKKQEIANEKAELMAALDPYGGAAPTEGGTGPAGIMTTDGPVEVKEDEEGVLRDKKGEAMVVCPVCNGSGVTLNLDTGTNGKCMNCQGDGYTQLRKR